MITTLQLKEKLSYDMFINLYCNQEKTYKEIGQIYGCGAETVKKLNTNHYHIDKRLGKIKFLTKEDFSKLYIEQNLTLTEIADQLNIKKSALKYVNDNIFHIIKPENLIKQTAIRCTKDQNTINKRKQTCLNKYGSTSYSSSEQGKTQISSSNINKSESEKQIIKNKRQQTMLDRYGVEYASQNIDIKNKIKQSNLNHFGVESSLQSADVRNKIQQTNIERYGTLYPSQNEKVKNKIKQTCIDKYGVDAIFKDPIIQNKIKQTCMERYGTENPTQCQSIQNKIKETNIIRYGVEYPTQNQFIQEKIKQTNYDRYGTSCSLLNDLIKEKTKNTNLEKYGSESYLASDIYKNIRINRNIKYFSKLMDRTEQQSNIVADKQKFIDFITEIPFEERTIINIAIKLKYSISQIDKIINQYDCVELINLYSNRSSYEDEIVEFLKSYNITNIELNKRIYLDGKEIDIYLPDYKIGIEFNGNYWHSDAIDKYQDHRGRSTTHQDKSLLAEQKGIFLFHIFEYEWNDLVLKQKIKNKLLTLLNLNNEKIYARNCDIREVDKKVKKDFLDTYHLQGNDKSSINYGLYYNEELVAVMTFCSARFTDATWELSRFCSKSNTNIVGGANKLFQYFIKNNMQLNETCVTYSDFTKTKGNVYTKMGFEYIHLSQPNYIWINFYNNDILTRYQSRQKNENTIMHDKGYNMIADCGNKVWLYKRED